METLTTASYSVLINGEPRGLITPSRGIKQGDPLLPYLFLLCAEGLSAMLRKAKESHQLRGIKSSQQGVCISHLLLRMIASYFVEPLWRNANGYWTFWRFMRRHRDKQSIDKRLHCFLAQIPRQRLEEQFNNC